MVILVWTPRNGAHRVISMTKTNEREQALYTPLTHNVPDYYGDLTQRERAIAVADYLAEKIETLRPEEASAARVLAEAVRNQRLG